MGVFWIAALLLAPEVAIVFLIFFASAPTEVLADFYDPRARATSMIAYSPVYDLRFSDRMFDPIHQGKCLSCFVMAPTTSMEYWAGVPLPVQNIMDCSRKGNPCRNGGESKAVLTWAMGNNIYLMNKDYEEKNLACDAQTTDVYFELDGFDERWDVDAHRLRYTVWTYGPVVATLTDLPQKNGAGASCSRAAQKPHSVAIVGYDGDDNFLAKDSANGTYYWLPMGECGLGKHVLYVTGGRLTAGPRKLPDAEVW